MREVTNKKGFLSGIIVFLAALFIGAISYSSCEVGLGAAVDTQPPSINIVTPEVDKVIRDKFAISGTWSDDGIIDSVSVVLKRTDGKPISATKEELTLWASFETDEEDKGKGTWIAVVDPFDEENGITDSTYQATVSIKDKGNHSNSQSTTFTIDNTPPVIVLTRPSTSALATSSDTYGQTFNLEGQAADTNNVSLIEVEIYSDPECTNLKHTVPLKNVPNSINMDVAKFVKGDEDNDYFKIYGHSDTDAGEQTFYLKLVAYDGAERYPEDGTAQTDADKKGNAANYYYLYKDIATAVLQNYKITEVYSIYNGTFTETSAARTVTTDDVLTLLEQKKITKGKFTLNPKNNPTFSITGRSPLLLNGHDFEGSTNNITNGSQLVFEVSPGLDGILLDESTLHVYAQECDASGKIKTNAQKIDITTTPQESGTSYRFVTQISSDKGFIIGNNYIVWVDGQDYAAVPNKIEPTGLAYGFHMSASGKAPVIEITTPSSSTEYSNKSKQVFEGTVTVEEGIPVVIVTSDGVETQIPSFTNSETLNNETKYYFEWEAPEFANTNGTHKFIFKATLEGESQPVERTIVYDIEKPVIETLKINEAKKYDTTKEDGTVLEGRYLNGTVTASVGITDTYDSIKSATYKIIINGNEAAAEERNITNPTKFTFPAIDTTQYADDSTLTIKITAKDRAGNTETSEESFIVDQSTDIPVIWPRNSDEVSLKNTTVSYYTGGSSETIKGVITAGSNLELKLYDDDGTDKNKLAVSVKVSNKLNNDSEISGATYTDQEFSMIDDVLSFKVPDDGGFYSYKISVKDKANNKSNDLPAFIINAARSAATITNITKEPSYIRNAAGEKFEIKIEGASSLGPYKLYRKIGETGSFTEIKTNVQDFPITDTITLDSADAITEGTKVYYYVEDSTPRDSNKEKFVELKFDDEAPEITITSPKSGKTGVNALSEVVPFSGRAIDSKSGVSKIFYKFTKTQVTNPDGTEGGYTEIDASNGPYEIEQVVFKEGTTHENGKLEEGKWYYYVYAQDEAGNSSDVKEVEFDINLKAPELTATIPTGNSCTYVNGAYYFNGNLTVNVNVSDTAYIPSLAFQLDGTDVSSTSNSNAHVIEASNFTESKQQKLTVTATDSFGKSTTENFYVFKDTTQPVLSVTNPGNQDYNSVEITGTVNDLGVGVKEVLWSTSQNGTYTSVSNFTQGNPNWKHSITGINQEGACTYYFKAKDQIGNEIVSDPITFEYDANKPGIKVTGTFAQNKIYYQTSNFTLEGKAWDSNRLSKVVISKNDTPVEDNSLTSSAADILAAKTEATGATWKKDFVLGNTNGNLADGDYTFKITAYDSVNKASTVETRSITVDTKAPTVTLSGLPGRQDTKNKNYTFVGTAFDATSGVKDVKLTIKNEAGASKTVTVDGTTRWSYTLDCTDESWTNIFASQGEMIVYVSATDEAGLTSESFTYAKDPEDTPDKNHKLTSNQLKFIYDYEDPELTINADSMRSFMPQAGLTISGTAKDSYNLKELKITQTGGNTKTITFVAGSDTKNWSVDVPFNSSGTKISPEDGHSYKYTFELFDIVGNKVIQYSTEATADFAAPVITITAPVNKTGTDAVDEVNYQLKGSFTEDNMNGMYYKILDSSATAPSAPANILNASAWTSADWTSINFGTGTWNFYQKFKAKDAAASVEGLAEGKYKVYLFAVDEAGNISTSQAGQVKPVSSEFDVDLSAPTVDVNSTVQAIYNANNITNNKGEFVFGGTAYDSNGIASVTIQNGSKSYTPVVSDGTYSLTFKYGSGNSSQTNYLADGTYNFTVTATDTVGKPSTATRSVIIDTGKPSLSNVQINGAASDPNKWYNTTDMRFTGSVTDNTGGSGISAVVYQRSTLNGTTWSAWSAEEPFIGTSTWKGTISEVTSKTTKIKVTAKDNAENETSVEYGPWNIDTNPPTLTSVKEGNETLSEETAYYSNGQNNITLTITAADGTGESGVDKVYVLPYAKLSSESVVDANKATKKNDGSYQITIQKTALTKSGTIYARIYDAAGNYTDENLFAITLDSTKPVLQSYTLTQVVGQNSSAAYKKDATTYYVNPDSKTFTLSGIATDNLAIGNVNLTMTIGSTVKYNQSVTDGEWSFSGINMSAWGGDSTTVTATITVTDKAQNTQDTTKSVVSEFSIIFDKTKPTSNHQIDAKGKDLVFRIADSDNDDISSDVADKDYAGNYNLTWNSATVGGTSYTNIDSKAGGKYSAGTFGNTTTVKVRGVFEDSASGIKRIYYRVFDRSDENSSSYILNGTAERYNLTDTELNSLIDEVLSKNLYFEPDGTTEYKRVFYNVNKAAYDAATTDEARAALTLDGTLLQKKDANNVLKPVEKDGYYKYWKIIPTTYTFTIPSIREGSNYLVLVAEDNAGNRFIDAVTVKFDHDGNPQTADINAAFSNFSMNLDTTAPTVESTHDDIIYSNGTDECNISVTAEDPEVAGIANSCSGVKSVVFSRDGTTTTVKASAGENNTYTADIKELLPSSGTVLIYATVTDNAYTSLKRGVATVAVDTTPPTVTIKSPAADSNVNKTITLKFTVADSGNGSGVSDAAAPELYYSTKPTAPGFETAEGSTDFTENATTGWKKLTATSSLEDGEWSFSINTNTTQFNNTGTDKSIFFTVSAKDNVGNTGYAAAHKLVVNQDGDRPVIKMNQVKKDGSGYLTTKTVFGSVSDDDGTINKLWVWSTKLNSGNSPTSAPALTDNGKGPTGWILFGAADSKSMLENNNWQIDSSEADGSTTWFWAVADADNSVFWTKDSSSLNQPYITYSDENKQPNTTGITFKYDTESPEINSVELLRLKTNVYKESNIRYAASEIAGYVRDLGLEWSSANNIVFGKDDALMYIKVEVTEKTAMNSTTPIALDYITLANTDISVGDPVNNKYTYYLGPFDLSAKTTENRTLTFIAKDDAGKTGSKEKAIVVDNAANITISNVSPAVDEIASGKFTYRGQVSDAESSVTKVEYFIPKYSEKTALDAAETDAAKKTLLDSKSFTHITTATSIQWSIDFNNFNDDVLGYKTNGTQVSVSADFDDYNIGENIYRVPVWFKVTDSVGNIGYVTNNAITYDPNEDRPKVYITDPEIKAENELEEKGGRVKISGNAQDNEGIAAVYLQFKVGSGNWTNSDADGAINLGTISDPIYGFKANNTKNWNYTYDVSEIADGTVLNVRAIAVDNDTGLLSAWSDTLQITVNNELPFLDGDMYLRQYDGNTLKVEKIYEPNMYIKGEWKLEGKISTTSSEHLQRMEITINDDTDHKAIWIRTNSHAGTLTANGSGVTIAFAGADDKSLSFSIPVSGSSEWKTELKTTDKAGHDGTETPQINIDNTAPSFADYTDKPNNKIVLYQDSYGAGGTQLGSDHFIQNSNGAQFTLAGKIVEEQSGFDKAVFYFKRTGSDGVKRVYNPMEEHGTNNLNNRANIATSKANAIAGTGGTIYINSDELPVRPLTVTRSTTESAQNNEIMTNKNIRVGGLVYIGGLYRLITDVNRTTGTIKFEPEAATSNTDAEFVYGLVVDHNGERDNGNGGVDFDDGDGLLESYSGSTTANFRWEATFNSANIPDGPIDIYVVTFDKAGNIGYGYLTTKASNNAPRITKVMFGTDLNGNGVYDYDTDEFSTFYAFEDEYGKGNTKKGNAIWTLDTSTKLASGKYWTAKNGIAVIPEFVGGAGPFYYVFSKGVVTAGTELSDHITTTPAGFTYANNGTNPVLLASGANAKIKTGGKNGLNATWSYGTSTSGSNTGGSLTLDNSALDTTRGEYSKAQNGTETNPAVVYSFTFWDSTEESTPGTDTGSTILNAYVRQDLTDDVVPNSVIKPFEWNGTGYSKTVSTVTNGGQPAVTAANLDALADTDILGTVVTGSGTTTVTTTTITPNNNLYGASKANGHIELEKDLTDAVKAVTVGTGNNATTLGDDPKVSGKITFHGTSYDNTRLSSIWFKFTDFTADNGRTGGDSTPSGTTGYTQAAYYDVNTAAWLLAPATMTDNNWEFTVTDTYFNQTGHKVDWYLSIDTSKISGTAGIDKTLTVITLDSSGKVSSTTASTQSDDDAVYNKPTYKMDVVPYIKGLGTRLDEAYSANTSVFNRSANGVYPVYRGETDVKLYGFNLKGADTTVKFNGTSVGTITAGSTSDYVTFTVPTTAKSGNIDVTVSSVSALNNSNKNNPDYNKEANNINNNTLTDDRSVYVWGMDNIFNQSVAVRYPMFKVGKDTNQSIVFSYDRGGTTTYLNKNKTEFKAGYSWTQWYDTAVAIDTSGNLFGLAQNGDSAVTNSVNPKECSSLFFYPYVADDRNVFTYTRTGPDWNGNYTYNNYSNSNAFAWENTANNTIFNPNRVLNPKLIAVRGTNSTTIYSVYYDSTDSAIKFRTGTTTGKNNASNSIGNYSKGSNGSAPDAQVIESGNSAGEYAAVGVIPTGLTGAGTVVVCWNSGNSLKYKYYYKNGNTWSWSEAITIDADFAGEYCNLAVDAAGGIHMAYYRAGNKLKYAYLSSYNDTTPDVCMVDSYLSVGENISIETSSKTISYTENGTTKTRYVPYISYYSSAIGMAKVAWPVKLGTNGSTENTFVNGVNNDMFTGDWEVQVLPTALTTKLLNYTIGVGEKTNGTANSVMLGYGTKTGLQTALLY